MNLDESQKKQVATWIAEGLKLSDVQNRLAAEFGLHMTYMEVRLLVNELKLMPKDTEPPKPVVLADSGRRAAETGAPDRGAAPETDKPPATGGVSVSVDQLAQPGAIVSGKVTFSDGNEANWYLDQSGRLGVIPKKQGYKPSAADVQQFQSALETELAKMGF